MPAAADPFDELAALFLTQTEEGRGGDRGASSAIDVAICGNLPVMGAMWLAQFAETCARRLGATALVRLDGTEPLVEVFHGEAPMPKSPDETVDWLRECRIRRWIIKPPAHARRSEIMEAEIGSIAVLTGADEAAVVAAYRLVKEIVESGPIDGSGPLPRLVILGAEPERSLEVAEKLRRTIATFLGVTLPHGESIQRIDAMESSGPLPFPGGATLDSALDLIQDLQRNCHERPSPKKPVMEPPTIDVPRSASARVSIAPKPSDRNRHPVSTTALQAPKLISYLTDLHPASFECPLVPETEWGLDRDGTLHLLCTGERLARGLRAKQWAMAHRTILSLADRRMDADSEVIMHLFVASPDQLLEMQDVPCRLHLLAPVKVDGETAWYHAAAATPSP